MAGPLNVVYTALAGMPWYGWIALFTIGCALIAGLAMRPARRG